MTDGRTPLEQVEGTIFDIERYSTHDGPGIRTTLFLKGCFLRCRWCHNPESISPHPELMFDARKCLLDLGCYAACPQGALHLVDEDGERVPGDELAYYRQHKEEIGGRRYDAEACLLCGRCADVCYARALELVGRRISVADAVVELARDEAFYASSGGGVTVSGGEPLYQPRFTAAVLQACRERGLHTALDSTAYARWEVFEGVLAHADLLLLDLKHMDPVQHREQTGVDNALILENAARAASLLASRPAAGERCGIWVRMPVIPGHNDDEANLRATARFAREHLAPALRRVELLGYHRLGDAKSERLGREPELAGTESPTRERLAELVDLWQEELAAPHVHVTAR